MKTLVIAPHPDDELLGCGGTLLRRKADGGCIGWVIMTGLHLSEGWERRKISERDAEIETVREGLGVASDHLYRLDYPTARLETIPLGNLVHRLGEVFHHFLPEEVLIPHRYDIHTDHRVTFDAAAACTKWFRYPSIRRVMAYETPSETDFCLDPAGTFHPNYFINVSKQLETKLRLLQTYASEMLAPPFPRSAANVNAQATLRGSQAGCVAAEAYVLLKTIEA